MNSYAFSAADMTTAAANGHRDGYQAGYADAVKAVEVGKPAAAQEAVAYLDIGAGGYLDLGSNLPEVQLLALPKGRHALGIIGTYGIDGYASAPVAAAPVVDGRDVRAAIAGIEGSVAVGSDGEWVSVRRTARDAAVTTLRNVSSDCANIYAAYAEAKASTPASSADSAVLTNPYTGQPRDYRDVESDPAGTLIVEPGKPLEAASTPAAPGIDLEQFKDLIGFAAWNAINLPETDPRRDFIRQASELLAMIASPKGVSDACTWAGDGEGNWHTACGEIFTLMEGSPPDNKMRHCPYCGKNLRETGTNVCVAVIGDSYEDTRSEARDAARYRWLRNHYEPSFHDSECDSLIGLHGEDFDDAIDDEMQATSAEVGE